MSRHWKVAVVKDTSKPMLGGHGLHVAFRGLPGVEITALVDANSDNLAFKLAQTGAARHYTDCSAMFDHEKPDIVVLCSRHPGDHAEQARVAMMQGCHTYCEKPVSVFLTEVDEMTRLADERALKFAVALPARHDLGFLTMKRMVESGEIGTPLAVTGRGKCDHRGGGEDLIVLGTHILDLMVFFFGPPINVMAEVLADGQPATALNEELVEPVGPALGDEVFASFRFAGGVRGIFESRRGLFNPQDPLFDLGKSPRHMGISVTGTKGVLSLRFDDLRPACSPLLISRRHSFPDANACFDEVPLTETRSIPGAAPLEEELCGQLDVPSPLWFLEAGRFAAWDLIRAIKENRQPVSDIHNAGLVVEMIQGIYSSHVNGRVVGFPLENRQHPLAAANTTYACHPD